jgi:hypothetical protein
MLAEAAIVLGLDSLNSPLRLAHISLHMFIKKNHS